MNFPVEKIAKFLPSVEKPTYKQTFNKRLLWTFAALVSYIILSNITVFGLGTTSQLEALLTIQTLLGARFGSLMTLGIGPIVTAGIILQLLVGSKIINWDMTKPEDREKFSTYNKLFAILFCFFEAIAYVLAGQLPVIGGPTIFVFVIIQLAAGGIIVVLLDELVSKWGFGSGISLFIAAGIATQIFINIFSPFILTQTTVTNQGPLVGNILSFFVNILSNNMFKAILNLVPLIATGIIFLLVVYVQGISIELPLSFSSMRGFGRTWSLKLLYTSNIPVILAAALLANVQLMGRIGLQNTGTEFCNFLGCYQQVIDTATGTASVGDPVSGLVYYLNPPRNIALQIFSGVTLNLTPTIIRVVIYLLFMTLSCMIFSLFWVNTSGMDASSVADQIESTGLQIPGYRSDKKVIEGVLNRYIPALAVLGGLIIGLLAAFADFIGAIGSGTGILLTVMIIYNYYEELRMQRLEEAHPIVRKVLGE